METKPPFSSDFQPDGPPGRSLFLREPLGLLELPRLVRRWSSLKQLPRGHGQRVLVLPGYATTDHSTWLLRRFLTHLGYDVCGWGLGYNAGNLRHNFTRMDIVIRQMMAMCEEPIAIVGWSLGGTLGRELAREHPDWIRYVMTMGSPVQGGAKYTFAAKRFRRKGTDLDEVEEQIRQRNQTPIRVPITALYSRNDGIVAWKACLDPWNEHVEHVEVAATHLGLGISTEVYRLIAAGLAAHI